MTLSSANRGLPAIPRLNGFHRSGDGQINGGGDVILCDAQALAIAGEAVETVDGSREGIRVVPHLVVAVEVFHDEPTVAVWQVRILRVFERQIAPALSVRNPPAGADSSRRTGRRDVVRALSHGGIIRQHFVLKPEVFIRQLVPNDLQKDGRVCVGQRFLPLAKLTVPMTGGSCVMLNSCWHLS